MPLVGCTTIFIRLTVWQALVSSMLPIALFVVKGRASHSHLMTWVCNARIAGSKCDPFLAVRSI